MKIMSYEEYEKQFMEAFRRFSRESSEEETEAFLSVIEKGNHIRAQYAADCEMTEFRQCNCIDPIAFASWAVELYPEDFSRVNKKP